MVRTRNVRSVAKYTFGSTRTGTAIFFPGGARQFRSSSRSLSRRAR